MKITGFRCIYGNNNQQCDAYGNNVAIGCPSCKHPLLLVAHKSMKGSSSTSPSVCENCGGAFYIIVQKDKELIELKKL